MSRSWNEVIPWEVRCRAIVGVGAAAPMQQSRQARLWTTERLDDWTACIHSEVVWR